MSEYKAIKLHSIDPDELNDLFDEGWEYVESINQVITSQYYHTAPVVVILKKETVEL